MTKKDIILFTGQSGIKAEKCINKLMEGDDLYASIDKKMEKISKRRFSDEILAYPPFKQEELWSDAFDKIENEKISDIKNGAYLFLTFHACYYHQKKTSFLSPINLNKLQNFADRIKMIIVLIDDCYDIYRRLLGKEEMYKNIKHEDKKIINGKEYTTELPPLDALLESIMNLLSILSWREIEIAFSRKISHCLGDIPFYVVGVKHPHFMVSRIIRMPSEKLKIAYLVHPISCVRKLHEPRTADFTGELNEFIKKRLKQENLVLFIPDTIDEKRIEKENIDEDSYQYIPKLSNSWPLPFRDKWLFVPIAPRLQGINPLNPNKFQYQSAGKEIKYMISSMLKLLETKINSQINSRDFSLVEFSNFLLVYRPYYCGTSPGGVEKEMDYNYELKTKYSSQKNRKVIMISATEDIGKLNIETFFRGVNKIVLDEKTKEELKALRENWLYDSKRNKEFYDKSWNAEEIIKSVEDILPEPNNYEFHKEYVNSSKSETFKPSLLYDTNVTLRKCWQKVFNEIPKCHSLSRFIDENDEFICASEDNLSKKIDNLVL